MRAAILTARGLILPSLLRPGGEGWGKVQRRPEPGSLLVVPEEVQCFHESILFAKKSRGIFALGSGYWTVHRPEPLLVVCAGNL